MLPPPLLTDGAGALGVGAGALELYVGLKILRMLEFCLVSLQLLFL